MVSVLTEKDPPLKCNVCKKFQKKETIVVRLIFSEEGRLPIAYNICSKCAEKSGERINTHCGRPMIKVKVGREHFYKCSVCEARLSG